MPEPNRQPWLIEPGLGRASMARLIDQRAEIGLVCHACRHRATWTADDLRRRFSGRPAITLRELAPRLRCGVCKSEWVEVRRDAQPGSTGDRSTP
jgi:hypothetical protein